ncbi:MAG: dephospho-CoA kinase [Candidatus Saccharibacteria bacterium]|nr:dephospho-CoA kinase [Candidatus Saccharibacteria bacterium]
MTKEIVIPNHVVELTGVMCNGKSLAASSLRDAGVRVEDIDKIAQDVKEPGQPAYEDIATLWPNVIKADGTIDNDKLRELTFGRNDEIAISMLQQATQPHAIAEMVRRLSLPLEGNLYVAYERPALLTPSIIKPDHRLAIIRHHKDTRRLMKNIMNRGEANGQSITYQQAAAMIEKQHTVDSLREISDSVIINNCKKPRFSGKILRWHEAYEERLKTPASIALSQ